MGSSSHFRGSRLDIFVRESLSQLKTESLSWLAHLKEETDEKNWSWKYLKSQIKLNGLNDLYETYRFKIKQSSFTGGLIFTVIFCIVRISTLLTLTKVGDARWSAVCYGATLALSLVLLSVMIFRPELLSRSKTVWYVVSVLVLVFLATSDYVFVVCNPSVSFNPRLSPTYIHLLVAYVFLPFPHPYAAAAAGVLLATVEMFVSGFVFYGRQASVYGERYRAEPLSADAVFLITCNVLGMYKLYLDEVHQRRGFLNHRLCIKSQIEFNDDKRREEALLSSILPTYIVKRVSDDIQDGLKEIHQIEQEPSRNNGRAFNELYIEKHQNVSMLFADIVNSVQLTSTLSAKDLVSVLDGLFGQFDDIAKENGCERLRILGDCYIAVSGVPDSNEFHGQNCVQMGLAMIKYIRSFREERRLNIDMRIGIHSGKVMSGILGIRKWEYNIWSSDVEITHLMEQTGKAGRVHISNQTKRILGDNFVFEENELCQNDEYLHKHGVRSYFVFSKEDFKNSIDQGYVSDASEATKYHQKKQPLGRRSSVLYLTQHISSVSTESTSRSLSMSSINQIRLNERNASLNDEVKSDMEEAINKMALSKKQQFCESTQINPVSLSFRAKGQGYEIKYLTELDPLYKYYLLPELLVYVALFAINSLSTMSSSPYAFVPYVTLLLPIMAIEYSAWHGYVVSVHRDSMSEAHLRRESSNQHRGWLSAALISWSRRLASSLKTRIFLWVLMATLLSFLVLFNMCLCMFWDSMECSSKEPTTCMHVTEERIENPRFYTYSVALVLSSMAAFLRMHYLLKLTLYFTLVIPYLLVLIFLKFKFIYESFAPGNCIVYSFPVDHSIYVLMIALCHHLVDRQFEYLSRLDFLWKCQLSDRREESELTNIANKFLLRNIVPQHVADHYLNSVVDSSKPYCEEYKHVAVMFANVSNFSDFYEENELNEDGLKCLKLLNELVCELDSLLTWTQFSRVEKIKVISSTYMAVAGLKPSRSNSTSEMDELEPFDVTTNVMTMVNLAFEMFRVLDRINKNAFQEFQFRIGIDCGPLLAGIVGAQKPIYDVWGDCVNVSSRMESTGEMGKIQVTEETAAILQQAGFECECRGEIFVKGKGHLSTYFVTRSPQNPGSYEILDEEVYEVTATYL